MSSKTILILYISVGQGHRKAAYSIQAALRDEDLFLKVICLDLLEIWPAWVGGINRSLSYAGQGRPRHLDFSL